MTDPKVHVVKLAAETSQTIGRSAETVRNLIRQAGYNSRDVRKEPFISSQNPKKRLEFAIKNIEDQQLWKKVIHLIKVNSTLLAVTTTAPYGEIPILL
ncbi:HTH_Tnp_Tc3_2 domain-containing protein [Trichonephila clavipes]|nr:HTH_Tnp_Tc3_2 domain-containing protein [Trichonephila clavipes]